MLKTTEEKKLGLIFQEIYFRFYFCEAQNLSKAKELIDKTLDIKLVLNTFS